MLLQHAIALVACTTATGSATAAVAQSTDEVRSRPFDVGIVHKSDVMGVDAGRGARDVTYLDNVDLTVAADLEQAIGWRGATAFVGLLNNLGGRPNDTAGTLQGVNNIEVGAPNLYLFQAWVQQGFADGRLMVLAGRYDINSEFYSSPAAGQLIGPAFGIGSELASTGPNGPSIFPRTELAVRVRYAGTRNYGQFAIVRAPRGTVDRGGRRTALFIAEAGRRGPTAVSIGAWAYSRRQPEIVPPGVSTGTGKAVSHGAYVLMERDLSGQPDRAGYWRAFVRAGVSDGATTPFGNGVQTGISGRGIIRSRPDSGISIGYAMAGLSRRYRHANPVEAPVLAASENVLELTYNDRVLPFLTLQPDIQYVARPSGLRAAKAVVVMGLRAIINWELP